MSKITLEPNSSGAGTFSIVSPDSNINRTLTLPDASGTLARTESLVGQVCFFAMDTAPDGFLKANGAAVSRTTFSALFNAIGTTFGSGDGSTTFNLPDMRGEFPRGWDDGRGVDSGRSFGTAQIDQMQSHDHFSGMASFDGSAARDLIGELRHGTVDTDHGSRGFFEGGSTSIGSFTNPGANREGLTSTARSGREGAETRPRNISLLACIKF